MAMAISKRIAHQSLNRLQVILGQLELALLQNDRESISRYIEKAKKEIDALSKFIRESTE